MSEVDGHENFDVLSSDRDAILTFLGNFSDVIGRKAGQT
jgi:hypothetical protein